MMGKSHLIISTGLTLSILNMSQQSITIPVVAVTIVSSLLPDIDEPNSLLVNRTIPSSLIRLFQFLLAASAVLSYFYVPAPSNLPIAILVGLGTLLSSRSYRKIIMLVIGAGLIWFGHDFSPWNMLVGALLILCCLSRHRGITHSVYGLVTWMCLLAFAGGEIDERLWLSGGLSYAFHLLSDSLTKSGIRPLPPFKFKLKAGLMSTGSWSGKVVENVSILLTLLITWMAFSDRIIL